MIAKVLRKNCHLVIVCCLTFATKCGLDSARADPSPSNPPFLPQSAWASECCRLWWSWWRARRAITSWASRTWATSTPSARSCWSGASPAVMPSTTPATCCSRPPPPARRPAPASRSSTTRTGRLFVAVDEAIRTIQKILIIESELVRAVGTASLHEILSMLSSSRFYIIH